MTDINTTAGRTGKKGRILTISLIFICLSFQAIGVVGISLFLPEIRQDLALSFTQAGTISSATILFYALMQVPTGYLADRFGAKKLFAVGMLGTTILSLTFGLIAQYWQAITTQAVIGFFRALLFAPGMALLIDLFGPRRRATAMGFWLLATLAGNILLSVTGPLLVSYVGWRFPFIIFSIPGIIIALFYLKFGKDTPDIGQHQKIDIKEGLDLLRTRVIWFCGVIQYIRLAIMLGVEFWLPTILVEEKGLTLEVTGLIMALRFMIVAASSTLGGYISDRMRNPFPVIIISLVVLIITVPLLVIIDNIALLVVAIVINSFFVQFYFGPLFSIPARMLGPHVQGTAAGFGNFFANIGGFTFILLLGVLKDVTGSFVSSFYIISMIGIVSIVFTILLAYTTRENATMSECPD
jgi:sugar phosphate permease